MLRASLIKNARPLATRRLFSTSTRVMSAGDTGSGVSRAEGMRAGDAWTKRETAAEEMYIKQEERAKLLAIKAKLQQQQKHIDELTKHIDEVTKESGGQGEQQH
ncbi:hypothetical protein BU26DRAFT_460713 [Trematosphaeria pertusa]|uniref:ATPase inhibitor, mitochondrial n=1 Tax=Trematosphaeria pertusa TaxID=390896 RepID=A0A6A6I8Q2_9PLEO|nr:uncharacterized protein BU26DRAFT_460713 [Trematosphaeria pertusa]KAF2246741.1 hypothetical protein BU26DRAFT_460713 [Trematosphaeria pertusa]